jgi:bifunctional non-homologous end joining protein LigD
MDIPDWTQATLPTHELCELKAKLPDGDDWRYEIKWDGYRAFLIADGGKPSFYSRNGNNLGESALAAQLAEDIGIPVILDGELVVLDEDGRSRFGHLRVALGKNSPSVRFVAFDILRLDDMDLRGQEFRHRLEFLEGALTGSLSDRLMLSPEVKGSPKSAMDGAFSAGLEGIVAKKLSSKYSGRRSPDWVKVKCRYTEKGLVIGYTLFAGSTKAIGALVIGVMRDGKLRHVGRVGTGFSHADRGEWFRRLEGMKIERPEMENLTKLDAKGVTWVQPAITVEFNVAERTGDGNLRQASFAGEVR